MKIPPLTARPRHSDARLLLDWARVVRRLGRLPRAYEYNRYGSFQAFLFRRRFGSWAAVPLRFFLRYRGIPAWEGVCRILISSDCWGALRMLPVPPETVWPSRSARYPDPAMRRDRPACGNPMAFPTMCHEPVNESGVVLLFGSMAWEMGFLVVSVQAGFPDCEAMRKTRSGRWQRVSIEFEFESRNFRSQGHPVSGCDIIVCWRHNWLACPLKVIELSRLIGRWPWDDSAAA